MNIALFGARGRMGVEITRLVATDPGYSDLRIAYAVTGGTPSPAREGETVLTAQPDRITDGVDVVIDFSTAAGTRAATALARRLRVPALIATTGLSGADEEAVRTLATEVPVIRATNTSIVVTAMLELVSHAAKLLGPGFDAELVEIHHRMKKDAPSGTALSLVEELAAARGAASSDLLHLGRAGNDAQRKPGEIGAYGVRGGDVAGEHTVYFLGDGERLEITQRATSRVVFARGALTAARWLCGAEREGRGQGNRRAPGMFTMKDVLHG